MRFAWTKVCESVRSGFSITTVYSWSVDKPTFVVASHKNVTPGRVRGFASVLAHGTGERVYGFHYSDDNAAQILTVSYRCEKVGKGYH